jgi:serine protease inhibitor
VRVDRPYLFAVRDTQTRTVLFVEREMNSSA